MNDQNQLKSTPELNTAHISMYNYTDVAGLPTDLLTGYHGLVAINSDDREICIVSTGDFKTDLRTINELLSTLGYTEPTGNTFTCGCVYDYAYTIPELADMMREHEAPPNDNETQCVLSVNCNDRERGDDPPFYIGVEATIYTPGKTITFSSWTNSFKLDLIEAIKFALGRGVSRFTWSSMIDFPEEYIHYDSVNDCDGEPVEGFDIHSAICIASAEIAKELESK